jgi:hypothetical protein
MDKRRKDSVSKRMKEKDRRRKDQGEDGKEQDEEGEWRTGTREERTAFKEDKGKGQEDGGKGAGLSLRLLVRSDLLPTRIKGMFESCFTRRICSRNSWTKINDFFFISLCTSPTMLQTQGHTGPEFLVPVYKMKQSKLYEAGPWSYNYRRRSQK